MATVYSDKVAAKTGTNGDLDALKNEARIIEERLLQARNQYNTWVQKSDMAKAEYEKLQKDVADWERKKYADMDVKESDLKARESNVIKHENDLKEKIIETQRLKMRAEDSETKYKEALTRTETYFAGLKNIQASISSNLEELDKKK
jgi:hypothetical protein